MYDVGVLWLNVKMDLVAFWCDGYHRGQYFLSDGGSDPPMKIDIFPGGVRKRFSWPLLIYSTIFKFRSAVCPRSAMSAIAELLSK